MSERDPRRHHRPDTVPVPSPTTKTNPTGTGNAATYDGTKASVTFFVSSIYAGTWMSESSTYVKRAWYAALSAGNEIGNHTHTHAHGSAFTQEQWETEIQQCNEWLHGLAS